MKKNDATPSMFGQLLSYMQPEVSSGNTLYHYFFSYVVSRGGNVVGFGNIGLGLMKTVTHIDHIRMVEKHLAEEFIDDPSLKIVVQNFHLLTTIEGTHDDDVTSGNYTLN